MGTDPKTGQPITTAEWIDRLAPKAAAVIAVGACATYGGIHAMAGNPTGAMGLADYLGWKWRSLLGLPVINIPGCPVQPDNFTETLLYLLYQVVGLAPMQRYAATPVRLGTLQSSPDTQEPLPSPRKLAGRLATSGRCTHRGPASRLSVDRLSLTRVTGAPRKPLKLIREGKKITERYQNNPVLAENTHAGIDSHLLEVGQNNNGNGYGVGIQQTRDE